MVKYNFSVPRSRGLQNTACDVLINNEEVCARDLIIYLLLGRIALTDGTTHEIETIFNNDLNTIEIDIPDSALLMLEGLGIGPNLQRYLTWLLRGSDLVDLQSVSGDYTLTKTDSILVVTTPSTIMLPSVTEFITAFGKRYDIKCRTTLVEVVAEDGIDDQNLILLERNENLTITPTEDGWIIL